MSLLKGQGMYVISIQEKKETIFDTFLNFRGVSQTDVVTFTRQFSTMISAGLPISRALEVLAAQTQSQNFKKVIYDILRNVEGGASLSTALGRYPEVFSITYQALVKAGESSGKMDIILKRLADNMEAQRDLNSRFKGAMIYPMVVMIAMVGVFVVLMVFVVPQLAEMYKSMDVELPPVTQLMISTSDFMVKNIILLAIATAAAVLVIRYYAKSEKGKYYMAELVMRLPVFGKINKDKDFAQFSKTLALLINSAVPIVEALGIVSTVMSSPTFRLEVLNAARQVEKGTSLSSFFKSSEHFPPLLSQMANVGEETGKMDEVLDRVATYYEGEVDNKVKGLSAALEPIILVILGVMVGFLIISIITPIYKITQSI
ncbi:MAG: Type II secretion system protein [candidate division WWE3 bacterium GW2011_GWA2_42_9]|nr:MAG: Type II secretion system protein [candidate division WWE3 bacterium GW2011_GWA2_42_9]